MRITRALDKARFETPAISHARFSKFAEGTVPGTTLKTRPLVQKPEGTFINKKDVHKVSIEIKKGYFNSLRDVYDIHKIPESLEAKTRIEVKDLPAYHYGKAEMHTQTLADSIKKKSPPGSLDHLDKPGVDITMKDLDKSPALKDTCEYIQNKEFRTISGKTVLVGAGLLGAVVFLNEHRKDMQACVVYKMDGDILKGCKLPLCTCINGEINNRDNLYTICGSSVLDILPADMKNVSNCAGNKGSNCVNCPSQTFRDMIGKDNDDVEHNTQLDNFYIECKNPTIFGALGDITHAVGDATLDVVNQAANAAGWLIKNLPTILIGGACIFVVAIIAWFLKSLGIFSHSNRGYTQFNNDNEKRKSGYVSE